MIIGSAVISTALNSGNGVKQTGHSFARSAMLHCLETNPNQEETIRQVVSIKDENRFDSSVGLFEMKPIDLVIAGSVEVN